MELEAFDSLLRFNAFAVLFRYEALEDEAPVFDRNDVTEEVATLLKLVAKRLE